jgi:SAM-dependent methyltransferase
MLRQAAKQGNNPGLTATRDGADILMAYDVHTLEDFYEGRIGQVARRTIFRHIREAWPNVSGQRVLGFGYASPYLRPLVGEAERTIAAIPEALGALPWGSGGRSLTTLVDELALPFPDSFFDCLLVVHGLEAAEAQRPLLRELWRVLTPAGRLMVIAPNRASLWAQFETSPFGHGQPYTRGQLDRLLEQSLFRPERWEAALYMPPVGGRRTLSSGRAWERIGHRLWPRLAGVHIVQATKSLYLPAMAAKKRRVVLRPAIASAAQSRTEPANAPSRSSEE